MEQVVLSREDLKKTVNVSTNGIKLKGADNYEELKYSKELEKELITSDCIEKRIKEMAIEIGTVLKGEVTCLVVLKGGIMFASDLIRALEIKSNLRVRLEFVTASSYGNSDTPEQDVHITGLGKLPDENIIIMEDIVDTGSTLFKLQQILKEKGKKTCTCVLLRKDKKREKEPEVDFLGFQIPDEFVVGYGLDYAGKYRALPYIAVAKT